MASNLKHSVTIVLLLALIAAPAVVCARLGASDLAGNALLACLAGLIAAVFVPLPMALTAAVLTGVGTGLAVPASAVPWQAGLLMAGCGVAMGVAARAGAASSVALSPIAVAFILAEPPPHSGVAVGLALGASATFGVGLGALVHRRLPDRKLTRLGPERAAAYGGMLALLAGVSAYFVVERGPGHAGAWLLLTYFVVIQPYLQDGWRKALERAAGTVLGFAASMVIGVITDTSEVLFVVGIVSMIVGMWLRIKDHPYWQNTAFLTVGVVVSEGASSSVVSTAEQRLLATVIGVAASLLAMAVLQPLYKRGAAKAGLDHY